MILLGQIHWFNSAKGFGFIKTKGGEDVFVHYTAIITPGFRTLYEGQEVYYQIIRGKRGLEAKDVEPLRVPSPRPRVRYH